MKGTVRTSLIFVFAMSLALAAYYLWGRDASLYSAMCQADEKPVICLRGWINPLAAVFTFIAIWYAARQVTEARQQSLASTRESLVLMRNDLNDAITSMVSLWDDLELNIPFYEPQEHHFSSYPEYYPDPKIHVDQLIRNNVSGKNLKKSIRKIIYDANVDPGMEKMFFDIEDAATFDPYLFFPGVLSANVPKEEWDLVVFDEGGEKGERVQVCEVDGVEYEFLLNMSDEDWDYTKGLFFELDKMIKSAIKQLLVEKRIINIALSKVDIELSGKGREIVEKARGQAKEKDREIRL
ncbi:hypothetical protein [Aestuariibius sp. HNIBRBA575]|uniref:hypothetical protein n=1 Tax=Aestuariibius sp. HNIBRBA575 TaxID=3233343 RepID=UPI0034A219A6